jgi:hypothetical protein
MPSTVREAPSIILFPIAQTARAGLMGVGASDLIKDTNTSP